MKTTDIKTILMPSPFFYLFNPAGIPYLTGYLKERGYNVKQRILDRESFAFFVEKKYLEESFEKIRTSVIPKMENDPEFSRKIHEHLENLAENNPIFNLLGIDPNQEEILIKLYNIKDKIIPMVINAYDELESKFSTLGSINFGKNMLITNFGLKIASLPYFPSEIDLMNGYTYDLNSLNLNKISKLAEDKSRNPLFDFYEEKVYPWLLEEQPDIIGIQINLENQIIPAFTLMRWIKENLPKTFVITGGTLVSVIQEQAAEKKEIWNFFDGLCVGMGEYTLEALIEVFSNKGNLKDVPNLMYKVKNTSHTFKIVTTPVISVEMNDIGFPIYDESRPKPVIPIFTAVGCYYSRCAFCEYPYHQHNCENAKKKKGYYARDIDLVYKDMVRIKELYDPLLIYMCDSDISPRRLEKLCDRLIEGNLDVKIFTFIRAERKFLDKDFCRKMAKAGIYSVYMGLEAGNQRINDLMDKGVKLEVVEQLLENFNEVGIISNLFVMIGSPSETYQEAMETYDFLAKHKHLITGDISISSFMLPVKSLITLYPSKYGITNVDYGKSDEINLVYDFEVSEGLQQKESEKIRDDFRSKFGKEYVNGKFFFKAMDC